MDTDKLKINTEIRKEDLMMLGLFLIVLIWSAINPNSYVSWMLAALFPIIMVGTLILTYRNFQFSSFIYLIVLLHMIILLIGAKYTYSRNPLFEILKERFDMSRNYYDRVGHFAQGFTPALMAKELLLRKGYMKRSKMFYFVVFSIVLAISAAYELLEFAASIIGKKSVLGMQGDVWDTQWDMVMALLGATTALTLFRHKSDKSIEEMENRGYK